MTIITFDGREYYKKENAIVEKEYQRTLKEIKKIHKTILLEENQEKAKIRQLLAQLADFILLIAQLEEKLVDNYFTKQSFEELQKENYNLYEELTTEKYTTSFLNPAYCVKIFGKELGQILSFFYYRYRSYIEYAFQHKIFKLTEYNQLFIEVYNYVKNEKIDNKKLRTIVTKLETTNRTRDYTHLLQTYSDPQFQFYTDIIFREDLNDLRYLFKYGKYISKNEIAIAKFLDNYPEEDLAKLAKALKIAFLAGFKRDGKQLVNKSTIEIEFKIGMEKLVRKIVRELKEIDLEPIVGNIETTEFNKQVNYDHKFDRALFLDEEVNEKLIQAYNKGLENNRNWISSKAGTLYIINFGEKPFSPENKTESLKLSEEQTKLFQKFYASINQMYVEYQPISGTSFSVISFPSPEITGNFKEIFEEIVKINMLDSEKYERIQQVMIDVLDQADHVIIKGKERNLTDLKVKLQTIQNPERETNFVNSGANVNIPLGEIFTSPQLKGTNGTLHVKETYQNSVLIKNLTIEFKDGYVENYSCTNFDSEEKNKQYVNENLLFPHKTLPMGEFAIGTNTLAYVVARKYNILDILPILITEKTAPHFAVGDTCFQMREDVKSYNRFNKKLMTACDNDKSILRKTERKDEAYTFKHNDIVLPFDEIKHIAAVTKNGDKIEIIQEGRFVLRGTEELNEPLIKMKEEGGL